MSDGCCWASTAGRPRRSRSSPTPTGTGRWVPGAAARPTSTRRSIRTQAVIGSRIAVAVRDAARRAGRGHGDLGTCAFSLCGADWPEDIDALPRRPHRPPAAAGERRSSSTTRWARCGPARRDGVGVSLVARHGRRHRCARARRARPGSRACASSRRVPSSSGGSRMTDAHPGRVRAGPGARVPASGARDVRGRHAWRSWSRPSPRAAASATRASARLAVGAARGRTRGRPRRDGVHPRARPDAGGLRPRRGRARRAARRTATRSSSPAGCCATTARTSSTA